MTDMKKSRGYFTASAVLFLLFALLTALVALVDRQPIGPEGGVVGLASINGAVFKALGENQLWYTISKVLGGVAFLTAAGFGAVGLWQLATRKSLWRVDYHLVALGVVYGLAAFFYLVFEVITINYRPVLMDGLAEASYPSTHAMLAICIMGTAAAQLGWLLPGAENGFFRKVLGGICVLLATLTAVGRCLAGVHWLTDVVAGVLLGLCLVVLYRGMVVWLEEVARAGRRRRVRR